MAMMPKRVLYRKQQKGCRKGKASKCSTLAFGEYGLKALERGWITNIQIEACRIVINRHMKRHGRLWIRIFPHKPVTKKPIETRMGKGKGDVSHWVAVIKPGTMLFEIGGVGAHLARESLRLAADKLGIRTCLVTREHMIV